MLNRHAPAILSAVAIFGEILDSYVPRFARPQQFVDDPSRSAGQPNDPPTLLMTTAATGQLFSSPLAGLAPGAPGRPADA